MGLGAVTGTLSGAMANKKEGGVTAGNAFSGFDPNAQVANASNANNALSVGNVNDPNAATSGVQNDAILGQVYGQGGLFGRTLNQEQDLNNNGFNLTNDDKTAYGQASGDIARQFGQNEQSLSQSLANRGLSNSGIAGQEFSNSLGNKNEQLAGLQTKIAQNRMQMNQQRLAQTQNFLGQLGGQAQSAIQGQFGRNLQGQSFANDVNEQKFGNAMNILGNQQGTANANLQQYQGTQHATDAANMVNAGGAGLMKDQQNIASAMGMASGGGKGGMS